MNYNCHKIGGLTAATIIVSYAYQTGLFDKYPLNIPNIPQSIPSFIIPATLVFFFAYYSSTWADLDHPLSVHGKKHPKISQYLNSHYGHRGITHYPITLAIIGCLLYVLIANINNLSIHDGCWWSFWGLIGGYTSHILLDTLNSAGVSLLAPFSKVRFKIPTGIVLRKKKGRLKVCWRYLRGSNLFDEFIFMLICLSMIYICRIVIIH